MSNKCRIEFYFKVDELQKLLNEHPDAKGIIVSEEITKEKPKGMDHYVNITHIKARVHKGDAAESAKLAAGDPDEGFIDGCPYPPGCTE